MALFSRKNIQKYKKKYVKINKVNYKFNIIKIIRQKRLVDINSIILLIIFMIMIIPSFLSKQKKVKSFNPDNEITIIIKGTGEQRILVDKTVIPNQIYLNNISLPVNRILYNLTLEINTIRMIWETPFSDCNSMFYYLGNIIEIDLSNFDSSQVTDMAGMFHGCHSLTSINFSNMNTTLVTSFQYMFFECYNIKALDLRSFDTSSVTTMFQMFYQCYSIQSIDLSSFNTPSLTTMFQMFYECYSLESLDLSSFNTSSVNDMYQTFFNCQALKSLDLSNFDTSSVTTMFEMFLNCYSLETLNIANFNTKKVTNMRQMFFCCQSLKSLDLSNFDTSSVENMVQMFFECKSLESLDLRSFNTSKIDDMSEMFQNCYSLKSIDLTSFDTSSVTSMGNMFKACNSLTSLNLSNFGTSKTVYLDNMFNGCKSLEILDISNFDTSSTKTTKNMFYDCQSIKSLDLSHFNTSKVEDMNGMFFNCSLLAFLELGNFDTSLVTDMSQMFYNCESLMSLNLYSFNTNNVIAFDEMFDNLNISIFCINEDIKDGIKSQLFSYNKANCSEVCYANFQKKYILEKNKCINNCTDDKTSIFEYDNICYAMCPNGTHSIFNYLCEKDLICNNYYNYEHTDCIDYIPLGYYLNDTIKKTLDKCNIKCSNCSNDSVIKNLCISCNNSAGYYAKFNDSINDTIFINCYNEPQIGYYLDEDENIYNLCYSTCKSCTDKGNSDSHRCSDCYPNYNLINGNCELITDIETTYKKIIEEEFNSNENIYSYEINNNLEDMIEEYKNMTFINLLEKDIEHIYNIFNLNKEKDKIYAVIVDKVPNDTRTATSDYNYKLFLENKTELNLSTINEDIYVDFYVPITDLELANFNYSKNFLEQGYDIYNTSSDFYNDYCTPAYQGDNDITLADRKKYIYPKNVTFCKSNCNYNGVDIENERIICSCNLNTNNQNSNEEDDFLEEDDDNFLSYFLDNINYKIFKCYKLLSTFNNLKNNFVFDVILVVFIIILILNLVFCFSSLPTLKKSMLDEMPTDESIKKEVIKELKRIRKSLNSNQNNPIKKNPKIKTKKNKNKIEQVNTEVKNGKKPYYTTKNLIKKRAFKGKKKSNNSFSSPITEVFFPKKTIELVEENIIIFNIEDFNELTYAQALKTDKRNIFQIFYSLIIQKLELIDLICGKHTIKLILFSEYILSFLFNFFFNTLLYSDEVISNKYHNNGELDLIVTLVLSLLSNIITSIVCYFINYSKGFDERYDFIKLIKIREHYIRNVCIFFKYLKIKFVVFFICEIILISGCYYYIVIFCIIYSKSKVSLIINYLTSLLEGLITSIGITIIILVTRKLGLICLSKNFYNTSKYINNKF